MDISKNDMKHLIGPVMFDLAGATLSPEEITLLQHPAVGGVILFTRNYHHPQQLKNLIKDIRRYRPALLIAVDQEGGRVQRFRKIFTCLPAPRALGKCYDQNPQTGKIYTETAGWIMGLELRRYNIDFSFAPVLDLDFAHNTVIGDRAFHRDPGVVAELASAFILGMYRAGMQAVGKHFPGHGFVKADSHDELPVDHRSFAQLYKKDLIPFTRLMQRNLLQGIMPAHILYPKIDQLPAGFSAVWLRDILRNKLG